MYPLEVISLRFKAGELTEKLLEALTKDPRVQVAKRLNVGSIGIFPCFSRHGVQGVGSLLPCWIFVRICAAGTWYWTRFQSTLWVEERLNHCFWCADVILLIQSQLEVMRLGIVLKIMGGMNVEWTPTVIDPSTDFFRCKTIPQHTQSSNQRNRKL